MPGLRTAKAAARLLADGENCKTANDARRMLLDNQPVAGFPKAQPSRRHTGRHTKFTVFDSSYDLPTSPRFRLSRVAREVVASIAHPKPRVASHPVFNNQHLFQHLDRQPNCILVIFEANGEKAQWFHKLASVDFYAIDGILLMEVHLYDQPHSTEPIRVINYVNPRTMGDRGTRHPENLR